MAEHYWHSLDPERLCTGLVGLHIYANQQVMRREVRKRIDCGIVHIDTEAFTVWEDDQAPHHPPVVDICMCEEYRTLRVLSHECVHAAFKLYKYHNRYRPIVEEEAIAELVDELVAGLAGHLTKEIV